MSGFWTEERVETLKRLWAQGAPTGEIVKTLGASSNGMICGKVDRLGLPARRRSEARANGGGYRPPKTRQGRSFSLPAYTGDPTTPPHVKKLEAIKANEAARAAAAALEPEEPAGACDLLSLEAHMCKWPIGDPQLNLTFCGRQRVGAGPYCRRHTRSASASAEARERLDERLGINAARRAG